MTLSHLVWCMVFAHQCCYSRADIHRLDMIMWQERRRLTGILCGIWCGVMLITASSPNLSLVDDVPSLTPQTSQPLHLIYLSISHLFPHPCLIYFRCNMKQWCCRWDLWLQHPTTSVSHNSSFYPFLSGSNHPSLSLSVFICLFSKRKRWSWRWFDSDCNIPPSVSVIIYHFIRFPRLLSLCVSLMLI